jgi:hypothetical protein
MVSRLSLLHSIGVVHIATVLAGTSFEYELQRAFPSMLRPEPGIDVQELDLSAIAAAAMFIDVG